MNRIKTSNDRLRIAPEEIIAVEVPLARTEENPDGFIHLGTGIKIEATAAELEEIAEQWDRWLDEREDDEEDDDQDELRVPNVIDVTPEKPGGMIQRRRAFRNE